MFLWFLQLLTLFTRFLLCGQYLYQDSHKATIKLTYEKLYIPQTGFNNLSKTNVFQKKYNVWKYNRCGWQNLWTMTSMIIQQTQCHIDITYSTPHFFRSTSWQKNRGPYKISVWRSIRHKDTFMTTMLNGQLDQIPWYANATGIGECKP